MTGDKGKICVFYDGACPKCVKDRQTYEKLAGNMSDQICWVDITDQQQTLRKLNIDPKKALTELHVKDENNNILSELDAYILLMGKAPVLKPLAWVIGLPIIRPILAWVYHKLVNQRLYKSGRL